MRFLIAWEMGEHLGHITLVSEVAKSLLARGHQVILALKDTQSLARVSTLPSENHPSFSVVAAPNLPHHMIKKNPANSLVEVLANRGYDSVNMLEGLVKEWLNIFEGNPVDAYLFDFAPTALLTAKIHNNMQDKETPIFLLGSGYAELHHKMDIAQTGTGGRYKVDRIREVESEIVSTINQLTPPFGYAPIQRYLDLYDVTHSFLVTYPEFDRVSRENTPHTHISPILGTGAENRAIWSENGRQKVFAYLKPVENRTIKWIKALTLSGYDVCLYCPGLTSIDQRRLETTNLTIVDKPLNIDLTLKEVNAVVHNGGNGLINQSIQQGKPMFLVPTQVEQWDNAMRAEKHGVGLYLHAEDTVQTFRTKLQRVIAEPYFAKNAQAIAEKNHALTTQDGVATIINTIEQYISKRLVCRTIS